MDEYEPNNIKLTHSIGPNASDDDLLFLKQIGLRWVRLHYGDWDADVDKLSEIHRCTTSFYFSAVTRDSTSDLILL